MNTHQAPKENIIFFKNLLDFWDVDNLHKKIGSDISKFVDFFFCLTFGCQLSLHRKTGYWLPKVRQMKNIYNF